MFSKNLKNGDLVFVRPFEEICSTLDENGMLDGLEFLIDYPFG